MTPTKTPEQLVSRLRLRHLQLLMLLGQDPNVAHCAGRMHLTQPAASKLLREIEDVLGATLFQRNRRGLVPTPAGLAMTRRAALIIEEVGAAHAELSLTLQGARGHLRLGVFPVAVPELLVGTRERLLASMPDLFVSVHEGVESSLLGALSQGQLDCVMGRVVTEALTPDLHHEVLYQEPAVIVCGVDHPVLRARKPQRLARMAESEWIIPSPHGAAYHMVASRLAQEGLPPPRVAMETVSVFVTVEMINRSALLAMLPATVARGLAQAGRIGVVPAPPLQSLHPVGVIYRHQPPPSGLVLATLVAARQAAAARGGGSAAFSPAVARRARSAA